MFKPLLILDACALCGPVALRKNRVSCAGDGPVKTHPDGAPGNPAHGLMASPIFRSGGSRPVGPCRLDGAFQPFFRAAQRAQKI
jgi:hypothetical protein